MSKRDLKNLLDGVKGALPVSLDVTCFNDCLILSPLRDSLLRTIVFIEDRYQKKSYECCAAYLPLYYPLDAFILSFSKPVLRGDDQKAKLSVSYWTSDDCVILAEAIMAQAIPFLSRAATAREFAVLAPQICTIRTYFVDEVVALSHAQAGQLFWANIQLRLLSLMYTLQRNRVGCQRLAPFLEAFRIGKSGSLLEQVAKRSVAEIGFSEAPML